MVRQTVSLDSSLFGTSHPSLATHLENLGYVYNQAGFLDSANVVVKQVAGDAAGGARGRQPGDRQNPLTTSRRWSTTRARTGAAEPLYEEAAARMRRAYGPEHPDVV